MFLKTILSVPVIMENVTFKRATMLLPTDDSKFYVNILRQTGNFEVFESGSIVATGNIKLLENYEFVDYVDQQDIFPQLISRKGFYKECYLRRYNYKDNFRVLIEYDLNNHKAKLEWCDKFDCFLDGMLQVGLMTFLQKRHIFLPTFLEKIIIDPTVFLEHASQQKGKHIFIMF